MVLDAQSLESIVKALVISDKRVGHESQSVAFCKFVNASPTVLHVSYKYKVVKLLSYLLDKLSLYIKIFTSSKCHGTFNFIVATGSTTYYPALFFAKKLHIPLIALMYPKGYSLSHFKLILAGMHDNPATLPNIIKIPANLSYVEKSGIFSPKKESIAIIIGGNNKTFTMTKEQIKELLLEIEKKFSCYEIAITTSPRTPKEIEQMIEEFDFEFKLIYSKDKRNPIGDFLFTCKEVFITIDSTSMISSAISFGGANVCIVPLKTDNKNSKYQRFADNLVQNGYAYYFGENPKKCKKFDILKTLEAVEL